MKQWRNSSSVPEGLVLLIKSLSKSNDTGNILKDIENLVVIILIFYVSNFMSECPVSHQFCVCQWYAVSLLEVYFKHYRISRFNFTVLGQNYFWWILKKVTWVPSFMLQDEVPKFLQRNDLADSINLFLKTLKDISISCM